MATITAESAAIVAEIHVSPGQSISAGTIVLTTELMKMRHDIRAEQDGVVTEVHVHPGQELQGGEALVLARPQTLRAVARVRAQLIACKGRGRLNSGGIEIKNEKFSPFCWNDIFTKLAKKCSPLDFTNLC